MPPISLISYNKTVKQLFYCKIQANTGEELTRGKKHAHKRKSLSNFSLEISVEVNISHFYSKPCSKKFKSLSISLFSMCKGVVEKICMQKNLSYVVLSKFVMTDKYF